MRSTKSDQAFRVKIETLDQETGDVTVEYAGPYANRGTARGQETRLIRDDERRRRISPRYHDRYLKTYTMQESSMQWIDSGSSLS